jgi:hypothetical protein
MPAGTHNIIIEKGASFDLALTVEQPAGTPLDISNHTIRGQVRRDLYEPTINATFVATKPGGGTDGKFVVTILPADTDTMISGMNVYDIELEENSTGVIMRLLEGRADIREGVTK